MFSVFYHCVLESHAWNLVRYAALLVNPSLLIISLDAAKWPVVHNDV